MSAADFDCRQAVTFDIFHIFMLMMAAAYFSYYAAIISSRRYAASRARMLRA